MKVIILSKTFINMISLQIMQVICYDTIDLSKGINVNRSQDSKERGFSKQFLPPVKKLNLN